MGDPEKIAWGSPRFFSLSYSKRALTCVSVRYWGLAPPSTIDPPSGWALSQLTTGGTLSLISYVLPSLRWRISCYKSFSISTIRAMRLALVQCAFVLIQPLFLLEAPRSFVWRPLDFLLLAQRPQVAHWYFCYYLVLEPCSSKGLLLSSPLPNPQQSRQNVRVLFQTMSRPKLKQGPLAFQLLFKGTRLGSSQLNGLFTNQAVYRARIL